MKERPILFSAPMVRAILAGTKTQTRRVVKPRKDCDFGCELAPHELAGEANGGDFRNAYCAPGERLWVREAWRTVPAADGIPPRDLMNVESFTHYEADGAKPAGMGKLRPGMFMPRWASRITLEVTCVRVERLQDISNEDARAEGVMPDYADQCASLGHPYNAIPLYRALWQDINGPGSWDANPWVWVVEFKRADRAGAAAPRGTGTYGAVPTGVPTSGATLRAVGGGDGNPSAS